MTLDLSQTRNVNPWNLSEGDRCYQILIETDITLYGDKRLQYSGKVSVPASEARHLQEAATLAFSCAQKDGLDSPMMCYCAFYFYDEDQDGWVQFL